jgi:uncharacterized protein YeaO (DUF488 family)
MITFKKTKSSFYGKWLYKASICLEGSSVIRYRTLDQLLEYFKDIELKTYHSYSIASKVKANKDEIFNVAKFFDSWSKDLYAIRSEQGILDIYTNDTHLFNSFIETFNRLLRSVHQPEINDISLLQNKKNIVVKKYPHDRYKFKVFLLPHKVKDIDQKHNLLDWVELQNGKITISTALKEWFITTNWNWDRRYVLVEDEHTLLMLKLKNSDAVGSIYDYVISDK